MNDITVRAPTTGRERIHSLDVLRGFALLGILVMNIQAFSMPFSAYMNPTNYGDFAGVNWWVWGLSHLLADSKFITIFSMLFGAGIVLMTSRMDAKGISAAVMHYRRTLFLLLFGLAHAYLLWYGDILVWYSLCGSIVFLFRKRLPRTLVVVGLVGLALPAALSLFFSLSMPAMPPEARADIVADWSPSAAAIERETRLYRSGWLDQMEIRAETAAFMHTFIFLFFAVWRVSGLMLIGMALYKWGVLSARCSRRCYLAMAGVGLGLGYPLVAWGIAANTAAGWAMEFSMFLGSQFNYWGSVLIATGYIGVVMLVCQSGVLGWLTGRLAAVGRMALSNYLAHTLLCTTLFYGHGLGLFGSLERSSQILVVFLIWALQLTISPVWLRHFRFGPFEWLWRSLTYGGRQPMLRRRSAV